MKMEPENNNNKMENRTKDNRAGGNRHWNQKKMLDRNKLGILICAAVLVLTLLIYLIAGTGSRESEKKNANGADQTTLTTEENELVQAGDSNTSGVETNGKSEDDRWETMTDSNYGIEIQVLTDGYSGKYIEDGTDEEVEKILALRFDNVGDQDIQLAEYAFRYGKDTVSFKLSNLPAGQSCKVLEAGRHKYEKRKKLELISRVVAPVEELPNAQDEVLTVDNSDDTITIMNLTSKELPIVRVFYKTYDADENVYIGGITYTATADGIPAGSSVTLQPAHFKSGESVILGSGVYQN